jgi:hypothetical protein
MRLPANMGRNSDNEASQYELQAYFNRSAARNLLTVLPRFKTSSKLFSVVG